MKQRGKRPAYQHYPGDEQRDTSVQLLTLAEFGLWRRMLNLMHDGEPYGHLTDASGRALAPKDLARLVGEPVAAVMKHLKRLEELKVFSRDGSGVVYSRRMVVDEAKRNGQAIEGDASTRGPGKTRGGKTGALFNFLYDRYAGCLNCGSETSLELHRIVPGRRHGLYEPGNVLLLCREDHMAVDHGELSVADVLAKAGVRSAVDLFAEFDDPRFAHSGPGVQTGNGTNTPGVSAAIPSSSSVAVCGLQSASASPLVLSEGERPSRRSTSQTPRATLGDVAGSVDTAGPLRSLALAQQLSDLAPELRDFHRRLYGTADPERQRDVALQLQHLQRLHPVRNPSGPGMVRAFSLARLIAKAALVVAEADTLRDRDKAIVVLLIKLGDTTDMAGSGQLPGQLEAKATTPTGPLDDRVAGLIDGIATQRGVPAKSPTKPHR